MRIVALAGCCLLVVLLSPYAVSQASQLPSLSDFHKGVNFIPWSNRFATREADKTLSQLIRPMGVNWIAVNVRCVQTTVTSPVFQCPPHRQTATDADIFHVVQKAHALGMRVMLRVILPFQASGQWAGQLDFGDNDVAWNSWFDSYAKFMIHLATLAREAGMDYFTVGVELKGTSRRATNWRALIKAIREVYHGPLIYAANHGEEEKVTWWDAVDAIGVDAYYPLTRSTAPTVEQLKTAWVPIAASLERLSKRWERPVIFTEAGYQSLDGTARRPSGAEGWTLDLQEQADSYKALFEAFWGRSWWRGVYWWGWDTNPAQGGAGDYDFTANNKPAENIIRSYYGAPPRAPVARPAAREDEKYQLVIYDDVLGQGWQNRSWDSSVILDAREVVQSGTAAIKIEPRPWGALALEHPGVDTSPYRWLEFFIYAGQVTQRFMRVRTEYRPGDYAPDSGLVQRVNLSDPDYLEGGRFLPNTWQRVRIPLAELGASRSVIVRLIIQDNMGTGQPPYFIDRIRLLGALP